MFRFGEIELRLSGLSSHFSYVNDPSSLLRQECLSSCLRCCVARFPAERGNKHIVPMKKNNQAGI